MDDILKKLQDLGYTFELGRDYEGAEDFGISVKDPQGRDVGNTILRPNENGTFSTHPYQQVRVDPQHRRKGIASAMYKFAEDNTGMKAAPASTQNELGKALWSNPNRPFGADKGKKKLTDEQLLQMISEFEALKDEDKAARLLGQGRDKYVYDVPGQDMVMKIPKPFEGHTIPLHKEYIYGKKLSKELPVETPILVKRPDQQDVLFQNKLTPMSKQISPDYDNISLEELRAFQKEKMQKYKESPFHNLLKEADSKFIEGGDMHEGNVGTDKNGKMKLIDWDEFGYNGDSPEMDKKSSALYKARDTFTDKMDKLAKTRVFRSIAPVLGVASNVVPSIADIKEGNPNTAAARMITGLAPAGSGSLDEKLMEQANIADKHPELQDPSYQNTLKNIAERRLRSGKSPVVESFSGAQVDGSATEDNDFLNKLKQMQIKNSQG